MHYELNFLDGQVHENTIDPRGLEADNLPKVLEENFTNLFLKAVVPGHVFVNDRLTSHQVALFVVQLLYRLHLLLLLLLLLLGHRLLCSRVITIVEINLAHRLFILVCIGENS